MLFFESGFVCSSKCDISSVQGGGNVDDSLLDRVEENLALGIEQWAAETNWITLV